MCSLTSADYMGEPLPWSCWPTIPDTGKNTINLLGYLGTLLAHVQESAVSPFHHSVLNVKNYNASLC